MASRNYNEKDLSFYSQSEITEVEVTPQKYGFRIDWTPMDAVGGYSIYRGKDGTGWELLVSVGPSISSYQDYLPAIDDMFIYKVFATIEGDLIPGLSDAEGLVDFIMTEDYDSARQDILNRLRTQRKEWRSHINLGSDLEQLEGEPNTKDTGTAGENMIRDSLTYDGRFAEEDLNIRAVPTNIYNIDYYTILDTDESKPLVVKKTIDL